MDKNWRPNNWARLKLRIGELTQLEFSPSKGYSGGTKDAIIEATASVLLEAIIDDTNRIKSEKFESNRGG